MTRGTPSPLLKFADFEVNVEPGELRRHGHRIRLQDKPFQILVALLQRPGALVSREELYKHLWSHDTFFDHNLNNAVDKLRKALNDSAEQPTFIATVPRRGYRFIAPVEPFSAATGSQLPKTARPENPVLSESTSTPEPKPNAPQANPAPLDSQFTSPSATRSNRKRMIGSAVAASLLLALLFATFRSVRLTKFLSSPVYSGNPELRSLVIQHSGAIDPLDEGFRVAFSAKYDTEVMHNAANDGFDRLKIISFDQAYYYRRLTGAEKKLALSHDWRLTCICAVEKGQLSTNIDFGPGLRRFDIELLHEGDKYYVALTKTISPTMEWDHKIEFPGAGDIAHPSIYELRYDHSSQTASLWIDGHLIAPDYHGHTQFVEDRGLILGSYSYLSAKPGVGVFRAVRFEVH